MHSFHKILFQNVVLFKAQVLAGTKILQNIFLVVAILDFLIATTLSLNNKMMPQDTLITKTCIRTPKSTSYASYFCL